MIDKQTDAYGTEKKGQDGRRHSICSKGVEILIYSFPAISFSGDQN